MDDSMNDHLVLIAGTSATGKSASLKDIKDPKGVMYLNTESNKKLPFKAEFEQYSITDPYQVYEAFEGAEEMDHIHTIVIDSLTYLMDQFETQYVLAAEDTRKAWGDYSQFFRVLMQNYVANSNKNVIFLAHTKQILNESDMIMETKVAVKGALNNQGVESYFSTVLATKKINLKSLSDYENSLLNITEEEEILGFKYVYQTRLTKETVNERIRSAMGMWDRQETYIDNNAQLVIDRLQEYYD